MSLTKCVNASQTSQFPQCAMNEQLAQLGQLVDSEQTLWRRQAAEKCVRKTHEFYVRGKCELRKQFDEQQTKEADESDQSPVVMGIGQMPKVIGGADQQRIGGDATGEEMVQMGTQVGRQHMDECSDAHLGMRGYGKN